MILRTSCVKAEAIWSAMGWRVSNFAMISGFVRQRAGRFESRLETAKIVIQESQQHMEYERFCMAAGAWPTNSSRWQLCGVNHARYEYSGSNVCGETLSECASYQQRHQTCLNISHHLL